MDCRSLYKLLLLSTAVIPATSIEADSIPEPALVINEIMPANIDMFIDPSFNYGSWIELYNPGATDIDIAGWYISNDPSNITQCPLGSQPRIVKAQSYLTLWFGHVDTYCPDQLDFKLENDYDDHTPSTVILSDNLGNVVIIQSYPFIPARISYARKADAGTEWGLTGFPTPGATNTTSPFASEQLSAPQVDVDSRLFTEQFQFHINIPEGATLYYTENGSLPAPGNTSAKTSTGAGTVNSTKIYRFRFYKEGMLPSPVTTRSYIYTTNQYGIPVVSIVTSNANLYSTEYGIWAKGPNGKASKWSDELCNWNRDWDRPANVDIIDASGAMVINQEVEMSNTGRYSRVYEPHSFKIEAKKKYGYDNFFGFTAFQDKPYNKYKSLKLRNGGNSYQDRFRDAAVQEIISRSGVDLDCQSYQPVHHYINGVYKGVINLREPNNKDYAFANAGIDEEDVDYFKFDHSNGDSGHGYGYIQVNGTSDAWDEWLELSKTASNQDSYMRICQLVDIQEFANYMAVEFLIFNSDWPRNNIKGYRRRPDGRFRFILFDLDNMLSQGGSTGSDAFNTFDNEEYRSVMVTLFHNMLANESFNRLFVDSYCIMAGSVFNENRCREIISELGQRATREMSFYGESPQSDINLLLNNLTETNIQSKVEDLRNWSYSNTIVSSSIKDISSNIPQARLSINGISVPTGHFKGKLLTQATISTTVPEGYTFTGWINDKGKTVSLSTDYKLKTIFNETLVATFTPNESMSKPVRINEVSAQNDIYINDSFNKHDWIELYNATSEPYDASGMYLTDNISKPHKYAIPHKTIIPANGYLIIWCDNNIGTQLHANFKLSNKETSSVYLTAADDSWTDTLTYSPHQGYQSFGRYPDGDSMLYTFSRPTIGKANSIYITDSIYQQTVIKWIAPDISEYSNTDQIYNILGQPVKEMEPGQIYIRNKRKFIYLP